VAELLTTSEVAHILNRSPGSVRLLVSAGVLKPYDRVRSHRGKPTMRFDAIKLAAQMCKTPWIDRTLPAAEPDATFWARDASLDIAR